jgi:hypothetical protein
MTNALEADDATEVDVEGYALVNTPMLNKGTAITEAERDISPARHLTAAYRRA